MFDQNSFVSLEKLARQLNLPRRFLRELASEGLIPALEIGGRLRFDVTEVQKALNSVAKQRASGGGQDDRQQN